MTPISSIQTRINLEENDTRVLFFLKKKGVSEGLRSELNAHKTWPNYSLQGLRS